MDGWDVRAEVTGETPVPLHRLKTCATADRLEACSTDCGGEAEPYRSERWRRFVNLTARMAHMTASKTLGLCVLLAVFLDGSTTTAQTVDATPTADESAALVESAPVEDPNPSDHTTSVDLNDVTEKLAPDESGQAESVESPNSATSSSSGGTRLVPPDPRKKPAGSEGFSFQSLIPSGSSWILRTLGALGIVISLLILLRVFLGRLAGPLAGAKAVGGVVEILARYPFGKGQSLVLLKLDRRILLVNQTGQGTTLITEMTEPEDVASILQRIQDDQGTSFDRRLEQLLHSDRGGASRGAQSGGADSSSIGSVVNVIDEEVNSPEFVDLTRQTKRSRTVRTVGREA